MLFNSFEFLFVFLPIVTGIFLVLERLVYRWALYWLIAASLLYYSYWNPPFVLLLLLSLAGNYIFAHMILRGSIGAGRRALTVAGVSFNLGILGYFKYKNFFWENIAGTLEIPFTAPEVFLPLGISFFTFQQIAFLIDTYQGKVEKIEGAKYTLFIVFFPQLIAGPIVLHNQIIPQMAAGDRTLLFDRLGLGISLLIWGLFKKVCIADNLGVMADSIFDHDQFAGNAILAWQGVLAYSYQLYFDFSAYSDMAIGLGAIFGFRLPLNFNSPYQAANIADFWRRWHITLSQFLRQYLYIPLGGNRSGRTKLYRNLFITMLIGGVWHGAGWTFIIWGAYHGMLLCIYRVASARINLYSGPVWKRLFQLLTFLLVAIGWAVFRSRDLDQAWQMLSAMFFGAFALQTFNPIPWLAIIVAGAICGYSPNASQWLREFGRFNVYPDRAGGARLHATKWVAAGFAIAALVAILSISPNSEFLYFQF